MAPVVLRHWLLDIGTETHIHTHGYAFSLKMKFRLIHYIFMHLFLYARHWVGHWRSKGNIFDLVSFLKTDTHGCPWQNNQMLYASAKEVPADYQGRAFARSEPLGRASWRSIPQIESQKVIGPRSPSYFPSPARAI